MTDVAEGGAAPVSEETPLVFHEKIVHELAPGVKMSNVIAACWLPNDVKVRCACAPVCFCSFLSEGG